MVNATAPLPAYRRPGGIVPDKRNWRRFFACWRGFANTGQNRGAVFEAYLAVLAPSSARQFHRTRAHPNGRKLFRNQPDLLAVLCDDAYLASLPVGSVGHAYRSYMMTNDLEPGVYDEATVLRPIADRNNWSEDYYWFMRRIATLHDFYHVIGGYGTDVAGELMVMGFQMGQIEPTGILGKLGYFYAAVVPGAPVRHKVRAYRQALNRGRCADMMSAAPWEELLDKPIDDVRELLGVTTMREAHPDGVWRAKVSPIGMTTPVDWDYDEVLARELGRCD